MGTDATALAPTGKRLVDGNLVVVGMSLRFDFISAELQPPHWN
jgi:hypothetical protein